jgi:hypothetical protein
VARGTGLVPRVAGNPLPSPVEEPAGRPRAAFAPFEESPDSAGQGAGESRAGVTSRKRNRKQTAGRDPGKGETVR